IRRPSATTVSAANMKAGLPLHSLWTLRAFSAASRTAWARGSSAFLALSSIAAGNTASGTMPAWASRARRRGLSLANTSGALISAETISDTTLGQIVWSHLDHDLVAGENADAVLAHLAGGMGDDDVVIGDQLHAEGRIGQKLFDDALELQQFFFGQWVLFLPFREQGR